MTIVLDDFYFRLKDNNHELFIKLEVLDKEFNVSNRKIVGLVLQL